MFICYYTKAKTNLKNKVIARSLSMYSKQGYSQIPYQQYLLKKQR